LDCSKHALMFRKGEIHSRVIDEELRGAVRQTMRVSGAALRLSMFPTPKLEYFTGQIATASCKAHLRALGSEMFGLSAGGEVCWGGTFTRFMIAGFATYRALEGMGVRCWESYPDLQFRLWNNGVGLPSKMNGTRKAVALQARQHLVGALARRLRIDAAAEVATLDASDAAIMALSIRAFHAGLGRINIVKHRAEGQFSITVPIDNVWLLSSRDDWKL
jgi:hypothetical protein